MKPTPVILGAITLAIGAGTALGMSTPTDPLSKYSDTLATLPQHAMENRTADEARKMIASRDQYPLETPDGVIEVRELVFHGRLRDQTRRMAAYREGNFDAAPVANDAAYRVDYRGYERAQALDAQQPILQPSDQRYEQVREQQAAEMRQASFVPLEEGIFERRVAAREIPRRETQAKERATRFAQRDAMLEGQARTVNVQAELAARK